MFRAGECIGFAETLPVNSYTEVPKEIQDQLDSMHLRIAKQESRAANAPTNNSPDIEPYLTWNDISVRHDAERIEMIRDERIRNLKNAKLFPQQCLYCQKSPKSIKGFLTHLNQKHDNYFAEFSEIFDTEFQEYF